MNTLTEILSHSFVHKLGWTLLHLLWQGAAVALLLGIVLRLLRKSSANLRYVVACSALALVVLAPAVTFFLISAPPTSAGIESAPVGPLADPLLARHTADMPLARAAEYMDMFTRTSWTQKVENFFAPALPYIVAGWVLGVFALSLWHLGGWTHLQRLRRRLTKQADASLLAKLGALAEEVRITRPVRLVESALVQIPTVVGWLRPVILLPATALTGLSSDQVEALLAHELAHIRRGDYLINMLQTVVEILGFYHPAIWWISNKIRLERENCCDDIAVATCGDKMHYATALAEMERIRSARSELALAANGGNLLTRIRRLIGKGPAPKSRFNWAAALITAMVIAALAIPTTLALSRKYSSNAPPQPIVLTTSETADEVSAASVADEAQGLAQITFDCKIFELPADLRTIEPEPGEKTQEGLYLRTGNNYAQTLERLAEQNKDVKVLASPTLIVLEGKQGIIKSESKVEYVKGYEEKPGNKSEPIKDTVLATMELGIQGKVAADNQVRTQLTFSRSTPSFETQNDAQGREVQIPQIAKIKCSTTVLSPDRQPFIVGGLKNTGDPQHKLMLMITPTVTPAEDTAEAATLETVELDEARRYRRPSPAPVTGEAEEKAQILFELKYFALSANSKLIKDAAKDGTFVRTDKAFAEQLLELSKKSKGAKMLANPRIIALEGEEATFTIASEIPYIVGYTEQPDGEPKPMTRYVHRGFDAKVKGDLVGDNAILVRLLFKQTVPTLTTHKAAKGREIQIPIVRTTECATAVTVGNNGVVIIGGLQSPGEPDQTFIIQIVSRIVRKGDTDLLTDPLPIADSSEEISFAVAPQIVTSVRVDTEGVPAFAGSGHTPAKAVEGLIAMLKGQALPSFELLDSKMAVAGQLDDLRKLVSEQSVEIDSVLSDGKQALIATKSLKDDGGREGHLVFHLSREKDKWTIDDIDFEDPQGLEDVMKRFDEEMRRKARQASSGSSMGVTGRPDEAVGEKAEKTPPQVRVFALQYADASALSKILNSLLPNEDKDWKITADPSRSNRLIVLASETDFEPFTKLIELLDMAQAGGGAAAADTVTQVVELKYADSQQVVTMLKSLSVLGRNSRVVSDARLNRLIIQAPEADLEKIKRLIGEIDRPVDENAVEKQSTAKDKQLAMLIDEREALAEKMQSLREFISQLQRKFGITESAKQQDLMLQRTVNLMNELAKTESLRMQLEAQLSLLEQGKDQSVSPQERLKMRQEYVNSDATVKALAERIAEVEMELLLAKQTKGGDNPEVKNKINLLKALKVRLVEAKDEVGRAFDRLMAVEDDKARLQNIARAKAEIEQNRAYEHKLQTRLAQESEETNDMAQKQLQIQGIRDELESIKAMYEEANRRIMDLRMQPQALPTLYDIGESGTE